jgi:hypothetical protein
VAAPTPGAPKAKDWTGLRAARPWRSSASAPQVFLDEGQARVNRSVVIAPCPRRHPQPDAVLLESHRVVFILSPPTKQKLLRFVAEPPPRLSRMSHELASSTPVSKVILVQWSPSNPLPSRTGRMRYPEAAAMHTIQAKIITTSCQKIRQHVFMLNRIGSYQALHIYISAGVGSAAILYNRIKLVA